jgi:hypothetical protein
MNLLNFLTFLFLFTFLSGCSTSQTMLEVLRPSEIVLPDHIQTIAVVDRSKPEKGFANFVEGLISGESIGQDRQGRENAVQGLISALARTPRFTVKSTALELTGSRTGAQMMPPLDWREIEDICRRYDAHAVAAIESYDTDMNTIFSSRQNQVKGKDSTVTVRTTFTATRNLRVNVGWRLYDPKTRVVLDETMISDMNEDRGFGDTQQAASNNLESAYNITRGLSAHIGEKYGRRIAPVWTAVSRIYYTTAKDAGKEPMEKADRYVKAGDWEEAANIWRALTEKRDQATAGRAAHNLALAAERNGNLPAALEWARKAYAKFGNKASQAYIRILEQRIADQARLNYQMKERT